MEDKLDRCRQKCEVFLNKNSGSWRGVENYHGGQDLRDRLCVNPEKVFSSDILKAFRKDNKYFLKCSTTDKGSLLQGFSLLGGRIKYKASSFKRSLGTLLEEYKLAVAKTATDFREKGITGGYTTDPCDIYHTGYCPVSFKPTPHLWAQDRKDIYKKLEEEEKERKRKENMSPEEIRDDKIAAAKKDAGVSNEKCTFTCMTDGERSVDDKKICHSLQNLSVDCVKCGNGKCQKKAKERCVEESQGTDTCSNPSIKWKKREKYA